MVTNASVGIRTRSPAYQAATPGYYDVALRDLGLALGGFALARLAAEFDSFR